MAFAGERPIVNQLFESFWSFGNSVNGSAEKVERERERESERPISGGVSEGELHCNGVKITDRGGVRIRCNCVCVGYSR
ncbi:unnamed protein product [Camellia sinensis]